MKNKVGEIQWAMHGNLTELCDDTCNFLLAFQKLLSLSLYFLQYILARISISQGKTDFSLVEPLKARCSLYVSPFNQKKRKIFTQ